LNEWLDITSESPLTAVRTNAGCDRDITRFIEEPALARGTDQTSAYCLVEPRRKYENRIDEEEAKIANKECRFVSLWDVGRKPNSGDNKDEKSHDADDIDSAIALHELCSPLHELIFGHLRNFL
jgi:hypothetical protein